MEARISQVVMGAWLRGLTGRYRGLSRAAWCGGSGRDNCGG